MQPTHDGILARHDSAFGVVDDVVRQIPPPRWDSPSPNPGWTARHVLAHLIWGQRLVTAWAQGQEPPRPGVDLLDGTDAADVPREWATARRELRDRLTSDVLDRVVTTRNFGHIAIGDFLWTFPNDALLHAWDIAVATGAGIRIPEDLAAWFLEWGRVNEASLRRPGGFGPRCAVSGTSDVVTQWLAFAGRNPTAWGSAGGERR